MIEYIDTMVAIKPSTFGKSFEQIIYISRHHVWPVYYIPVFGHLRHKKLAVGSNEGRLVFAGEENSPRLYNKGSFLGEVSEVRSWRDLNWLKLSFDVERAKMEGQKFEDIIGILMKPFGVQVYKLDEVKNGLGDLLIHPRHQFILHNRKNLIILFNS